MVNAIEEVHLIEGVDEAHSDKLTDERSVSRGRRVFFGDVRNLDGVASKRAALHAGVSALGVDVYTRKPSSLSSSHLVKDVGDGHDSSPGHLLRGQGAAREDALQHVVLVCDGQLVQGGSDQDLLEDVVLLRLDILGNEDRFGVVVVEDDVLAVLYHEVASKGAAGRGEQLEAPAFELPFGVGSERA